MRYQQFLDIVLGRCRSLTFLDANTRQVDAGEVELAAYNAILDINDGWDLDFFTVINDRIAVTTTGEPSYAVPGDFGRLLAPNEDNETGIFILTTSDASPTPIRYREHTEWYRRQSPSTGQPSHFTINNNDTLVLDPTPDSNADVHYIIQGTYIKNIESFGADDALLVSHPTALIAATLERLAIDRGATQTPVLIAESNRQKSKLVNSQARIRQLFRPRFSTERRLRRGRR